MVGIYETNGIVYKVFCGEEFVNCKEDFYNDTVSLYEVKDCERILEYILMNDISISVN